MHSPKEVFILAVAVLTVLLFDGDQSYPRRILGVLSRLGGLY
jgi:hypothetical protein